MTIESITYNLGQILQNQEKSPEKLEKLVEISK